MRASGFGVYYPWQIDIVSTIRLAQSASGTVDAVGKARRSGGAPIY
jgi:hypothetical protein